MKEDKKPKPGFIWSILTMRCPRCRRGDMFCNKNAYKKLTLSFILNMYERCPVCNQKYDLEPGFWWGTSYISYGLAILLSGLTFTAWWILIGISTNDNRVFYWLIANAILLVIIQPWLMRISRVIYIYFFVSYNPDYENTEGIKLYQ